MSAGLGLLDRLSLVTEAAAHLTPDEYAPFSAIMVSGHGPYLEGGVRWNIAATDDEYRTRSLEAMRAFIQMSPRFPRLKQVNLHFPARQWRDEAQPHGHRGTYDRMIDGFRELAAVAAVQGIELVLENGNAHWSGVPEDFPTEQVDWSDRNQVFGSAPDQWIGICKDIDRDNVGLCLDSSHIVTHSHTVPEEQRGDEVMKFLSEPDMIRHVHWNDNYLYDSRGRTDQHALLGKGTLPEEVHKRIKRLDATLHIEHFYGVEELEAELQYIDSL